MLASIESEKGAIACLSAAEILPNDRVTWVGIVGVEEEAIEEDSSFSKSFSTSTLHSCIRLMAMPSNARLCVVAVPRAACWLDIAQETRRLAMSLSQDVTPRPPEKPSPVFLDAAMAVSLAESSSCLP